MKKELQHFGVLGMKWGKRRAAPPAKSARTATVFTSKQIEGRKGNQHIVERTILGKAVSKEKASAKDVKAFIEEKKAMRSESLRQAKHSRERLGKIAAVTLSTLAAVKLTALIASPMIARGIYKAAWMTGRVVRNSPIG